jgi:hypothetical protein
MDMDTFLTELYVLVDDWYKTEYGEQGRQHVGVKGQMSDSEVLAVAIAGQWRVGVTWRSERGVVRWMQAHGRGWFPKMIGRSAFNERVRTLWGLFIRLQAAVGDRLRQTTDIYECVDGLPLIAMSNGQALREPGHWLWESQKGHGTTSGGFFIGDRMLASMTPSGVITGWLIGNADINERWLLSAFLSARAACPELVLPLPASHASLAQRPTLPLGHIGCFQAVGQSVARLYLADRGFNSRRWRDLWLTLYASTVLCIPPHNDAQRALWSRLDCRWLAAHRQIVETVFARLTQVFGVQHLNAHSRWGQYTRLAAKIAAYHIGFWFNRCLGRPDGALETLLC